MAAGEVRQNEHTWQITVDSTGLKLDIDIYWTCGIMDAARKLYTRSKMMTPMSMDWYGKVHMPLSDTVIRPTTEYSADTPHIISYRVPPTAITGLTACIADELSTEHVNIPHDQRDCIVHI